MFNYLRYRYHGASGLEHSIDFMSYRWYSAALSALILLVFIGGYIYKYQKNNGQPFNYSVDFTGGIQVLANFSKPVTGENIVKILDGKGWPGSVTREFSKTEHLIRVKKEAKDVVQETENMRATLEQGFSSEGVSVKILQTDSVGGAVGSSLWSKSFWAIVISLILMLVYIAIRFLSFAYAMGAIVSLAHDAIVILAVFMLMDKEISINVIGAILAVLGYSINDTIVIFARIRENVARFPKTPIAKIINLSITETLSRTILTTFATLLVVVALFIFGGETLRDLSFALLIGIVFGIYSTIFIATPVLMMLYKDHGAGKNS